MNYTALQEAAPSAGDALAFRGRDDGTEYVVTGEVASSALEDTPADGDRVVEFVVDEYYEIKEGQLQTPYPPGYTPEFIDLPPAEPFADEPPKPAPLPELVHRDERNIGVRLPWGQYGGQPKRLELYGMYPNGVVVDFAVGDIVSIPDVLPAEIAATEVIL